MEGFKLNSRAETGATSCSGARKSEWSSWQSVTAPEGYVINKDKIKVDALVERGSENRDEKKFSNFAEIIPGSGIELPRTFEVRTFARSSKGNCAGGGATEYQYTGDFVQIIK